MNQHEPCARCGHLREAHEHFRGGTDCSLCTCRRFLRRLPWRRAKH